MSKSNICMDSELKIVLCQGDDEDDTHQEIELTPLKKSTLKSRGQSQYRNPLSTRKQVGSHSAGGLGSNPYQKKTASCSNCANSNKNNVSSFTQRIMSAKLLRFKQMQNQISEMSLKMSELVEENKTLKTLQRRQDNALQKYEGSKEQLPQLMKSHSEEVRIINIKFKQLKAVNRELENKLKQRDTELMNLKEQHSHLLQLSRDKHLCERDKLTKKLASLELYSKEQNDKILMLQRKLELQEKNFKHQLQCEIQKHRQAYNKPQTARQGHVSTSGTSEGKESVSSPRKSLLDGYGAHLSIATPARRVTIDAARSSKSESTSKCNGDVTPDEEDENGEEEDKNVIHGIKGRPIRNQCIHNPGKLSSKFQGKRRTLPANVFNGFSQSNDDILGRVSLSTREATVSSAVSDYNLDNNSSCSSESPRLSRGSGGLSIPSDLAVGNEMKIERVERSEDDSEDFSDDHPRESDAQTDTSKSVDRLIERHDSTRERAEEDIDQMITKACNDILASDSDHIIDGFENFSLSQELSRIKNLSWDEMAKMNRPATDRLNEKTQQISRSDYSLELDEKNHLLEALNVIDKENKDEGLTDDSSNDSYHLKPQENGRHQSVRQMFAQNRKKADLMKSIFGTDEGIAVSEGFH